MECKLGFVSYKAGLVLWLATAFTKGIIHYKVPASSLTQLPHLSLVVPLPSPLSMNDHLSTSPPLPAQSMKLPGYSPTFCQPASLANPAAARLLTPALQ